MNKKLLIPMIFTLILVIGITGYIGYNNRTVATISLDINPSIEINLKKNQKIKNVKALNEDAKKIVDKSLKGKHINEAIEIITQNLSESEFIKDNQVVILLNVTGDINANVIKNEINGNLTNKGIHVDIIEVNNITEEDIELAKKYNITEAKSSYINSILKEFENIDINLLLDKSITELNETKNKGIYCEEGYFLEGDFCLKEIERKQASAGMVCPVNYYELNGKCYEETSVVDTDILLCEEDFVLKDGKCTRTITREAEASKYECSKGELKTLGDIEYHEKDYLAVNDRICLDYSTATHPVTPCELPANDPTERTSIGGKCYWHRAPVIEAGCPGKIQVNGFCWDDATSVYICQGYRDGKQYKSKSEYCENTINYIKPTVTEYTCQEEDFVLNGTICQKEESIDALHERVCPSGYTIVNNEKCINYNNMAEKVGGFVCDYENSRLDGNTCIIYEIVDAKYN